MRKAFITALSELAAKDDRIVLLTGDLGFTVVDSFADRFPDRFYNVGVAEQNLLGIATGLAESGFIPFVYSIATFATVRPYEFIRNGPVLHRLPVRVVGIGQGFDYGPAGPTHHALEDVAIMRVQPGLTVIEPADDDQATEALKATWNSPGPLYYRLAKESQVSIPGLGGHFDSKRAEILREGDDLLMISAGAITGEVLLAASILADDHGIEATVALIACLNPFPSADLSRILARFRRAITIEEHYITGGLGSAVAETIADQGIDCKLIRSGISEIPRESGSQNFLRERHGLRSPAIANRAVSLVRATAT